MGVWTPSCNFALRAVMDCEGGIGCDGARTQMLRQVWESGSNERTVEERRWGTCYDGLGDTVCLPTIVDTLGSCAHMEMAFVTRVVQGFGAAVSNGSAMRYAMDFGAQGASN